MQCLRSRAYAKAISSKVVNVRLALFQHSVLTCAQTRLPGHIQVSSARPNRCVNSKEPLACPIEKQLSRIAPQPKRSKSISSSSSSSTTWPRKRSTLFVQSFVKNPNRSILKLPESPEPCFKNSKGGCQHPFMHLWLGSEFDTVSLGQAQVRLNQYYRSAKHAFTPLQQKT